MPTESEEVLANWLVSRGIDPDAWFDGSDDDRRRLMRDLAGGFYVKGKTERYIATVEKLWSDVAPIVTEYAEERAVAPRLQRVERLAGETNTRPELRRAREALTVISREKLSDPRVERYDRVETRLNEIEKVIAELEPEIGALRRQPFITSSEAREENVNALLRVARKQGISRAGAREIAASNVRYRSGASPREFSIREFPIGRYTSETGVWSEGPIFRAYDDEGKLVGAWDHRPSAAEIREKWRS